MTDNAETPGTEPVNAIDVGTWYQAACSGLWYQSAGSRGDVIAVRVDGKTFIPMPKQLTAENGAKGLLIGEFHVSVEHIDRETDETYFDKHPVPWSTIKEIYSKSVQWFLHDKPRD